MSLYTTKMPYKQNFGYFNGIQILKPPFPQLTNANCSHLSMALHIDRSIRLAYSSLNPPYAIVQTPLVDQENWEAELKSIQPGRWTAWNVLKSAEEVGFLCWNGERQKIQNIQFVEKIGDETVSVDSAKVSDLLARYKSIVGIIQVKRRYVPKGCGRVYVDDESAHHDLHAVVVFGEYIMTADEGFPAGTYWVCQDSNVLSPDNPFGILFVASSLLIEAYSSLCVLQPILLPPNFGPDHPYPVIPDPEA